MEGKNLAKRYDPKESEPRLQKWWEKEKIYAFEPKSKKEIYSIDTPPPTVSGAMHIGHTFSYSQMDFIARYKRMRGFNLFYPFGTDDNGLPTERLIEKIKGVKSTEMERKDFVKLCLETLEKELRPKYIQDWKNIGVSADYNVYYTTINDHCRSISQKSFLNLYKMDRIYRKRTPFMWCPECQTAIAQVELKDKEKESKFVYMRFDTTIGKPISIATTRPELLPACVALHVHPDDKRYKEFIGKKAILPFFNREVEIYENKAADPEFGTGAVYHCTFGDMDDVEWIETFGIKPIEVMNKDGTLNEKGGKYTSMNMKEAREAIIKDLESEGRIDKTEPIKHVVNTHDKCGTEIEILMTDQWFIRYLDLKADFMGAGSQMNWYPAHMINRYTNWIDGLKWDWCISRQRHFGVPFPLWYCKKCGEVVLAEEKDLPVDPIKDKPSKKCKCNSQDFIPEKDVLDTWATSSLTPQIAASLFPKLFDKLYPMSMRPQAHDIITFWLFNTVVKSKLHYNKNPWKDIMISGWALDPHGKKMSKSKGNIVDPREMISKYSADALRFWAGGCSLGEDLPFQEKDLATGQKFATKMWNASKFAIMQLEGYKGKEGKLRTIDRWILNELNKLIKFCTESFEKYEYSKAKAATEKFYWHGFCDNYLEIVKDRLYKPERYGKGEKEGAQYALYQITLNSLKLMAPVMPYITEEVFQLYFSGKEKTKSIHISNWPEEKKEWIDTKAEEAGNLLVQLLSSIRQFKQGKNLSLGAELKAVYLDTKDKKIKEMLELVKDDLKGAVRAGKIELGKGGGEKVEIDLEIEIKVQQ